MYSVKETIIVEGIYDKIKLSGFIDGLIFVTDGFSIFNNKSAQKTIKTLAEKTGIVILTDSDAAGIKIRNFVKQLVSKESVKHAYIPEISGKERRKRVAGKEGILGVEGISEEIIVDALKKSGCSICSEKTVPNNMESLTKADLYTLGLTGGKNSADLRRKVSSEMGLPSKLSSNMLLEAANRVYGRTEFMEMVEKIKNM